MQLDTHLPLMSTLGPEKVDALTCTGVSRLGFLTLLTYSPDRGGGSGPELKIRRHRQ